MDSTSKFGCAMSGINGLGSDGIAGMIGNANVGGGGIPGIGGSDGIIGIAGGYGNRTDANRLLKVGIGGPTQMVGIMVSLLRAV